VNKHVFTIDNGNENTDLVVDSVSFNYLFTARIGNRMMGKIDDDGYKGGGYEPVLRDDVRMFGEEEKKDENVKKEFEEKGSCEGEGRNYDFEKIFN
jgi:hypothetical protein